MPEITNARDELIARAAARGHRDEAVAYFAERDARTYLSGAPIPAPNPLDDMCRCVTSCDEDPDTACSLSGEPHVHPDDGSDTFGPCPAHPDAPGDL